MGDQRGPGQFAAAERVDPARVPTRTLYTGATMPAIGLGTFGSDRYSADAVADGRQGRYRRWVPPH